MLNHEVNHKRNNREKKRGQKITEEEKNVGVRRQKYHTGGTSRRQTSRTGFHLARVTGNWEQRELELHKSVTLTNKYVFCETKSPL